MDPEKDKEKKDEDMVVEEKDDVVGAEVAAPKKSGRKRRRRRKNAENALGAMCAPQAPPRHIVNGRPAGLSDSDPEDDNPEDDDIHPFNCACPDCQQWRQPPGKDDDDPEKWMEEQLDKSTL